MAKRHLPPRCRMTEMPDWLINLCVQYPIATLNGFVAWYAWKQVRAKEAADSKRFDEQGEKLRIEVRTAAEKEIQRLHDALATGSKELLASKNAEIERLSVQFTEELKKLSKKVDELAKKKPG